MTDHLGNLIRFVLPIALSVLILDGCASSGKSVPVGLDEAVRGIEWDVKNTGYLTASDLIGKNEANKKSAEEYIRKRQCFFDRPNAMIVSAAHSVLTFDLKGSFTQGGSFKIAGVLVPTSEIGGNVSSGTEQKITWPVTLTTLSQLPDVYLEGQKQILSSAGIGNEDKEELEKEAFENYRRLQQEVERLEDAYANSMCNNP